jgi:hypothetical protein
LVNRIHRMFLRVLRKDRELRDRENEIEACYRNLVLGSDRLKVFVPASFVCPNFALGSRIDMYPLAVGPSPNRRKAIVSCIWFFIKNSVWLPTSEGRNGTSWLELFARYQLMGGKASLHRSNGPLAAPDSFKTQLSTFTCMFRRIVAMYVAPTDAMMFKPAHDKEWRLKSYGIGQHVPCISAQLCISDSMRSPMHEALACLAKPIKHSCLPDLHQGLYQVELRRLSKRAPPPPG